jgi:hypothetical protein
MLKALVVGPANELRSTMVRAISGAEVLAIDPTDPNLKTMVDGADLVLPLTLNLPIDLDFPGRVVFDACRDISTLRHWVQQQTTHPSGDAEFWLPLIHTAKGVCYAEAIAVRADATYLQPLNLTDRQRQPLYQLGFQLLKHLPAPPSVYLLGAAYRGEELLFDRLLPFPAAPALAGIQQPDLFTCHWLCQSRQPILDITIGSTATYQELKN